MNFKKITYLIDWSYGSVDGQVKEVKGFAVDYEPVRICVRKQAKRYWRVDHYDSGFAINLPFYVDCSDKEFVAAAAISKIEAALKDGSYQAALQRYNERRAA